MLTNVATACEVVALGLAAVAIVLLDKSDRGAVLAAAGVTGLVGLACDLRAATLRD
jgi:hypothetical protein